MSEIVETEIEEEAAEVKPEKRLTHGQLILRRFLRNRSAVIGLIGLLILIAVAIIGPFVYRWSYLDVDGEAFLTPPGGSHPLGTTQSGKDVLALTMEGTRKSLMIAFAVALIQTSIAALIGSSAAYFGGWWEKIAMWCTDLLLVVPSFLIIAIMSQKAGASKGSITLFIVLLAGFGWMLTARVVRSMTLSVKNLDYVTAARFMNVPSPVIISVTSFLTSLRC